MCLIRLTRNSYSSPPPSPSRWMVRGLCLHGLALWLGMVFGVGGVGYVGCWVDSIGRSAVSFIQPARFSVLRPQPCAQNTPSGLTYQHSQPNPTPARPPPSTLTSTRTPLGIHYSEQQRRQIDMFMSCACSQSPHGISPPCFHKIHADGRFLFTHLLCGVRRRDSYIREPSKILNHKRSLILSGQLLVSTLLK